MVHLQSVFNGRSTACNMMFNLYYANSHVGVIKI